MKEDQIKVVELYLEGYCDKQIAKMLFISKSTVSMRITRAKRETGTKNMAQLAVHVYKLKNEIK